jgi:hypothetical protein
MSKKQSNRYSEKLKNNPVFDNQMLRSDSQIKKLFDDTFRFCKEFLKGDMLDELYSNEEDDDCGGDTCSGEKTTEKKSCNEKNNEKNCCKGKCEKEEIEDDCDDEEEIEDLEDDNEDEIEDLKSQFAVLLSCLRLYKIFEHILLKAYLYNLGNKVISEQDVHDFTAAMNFFKAKKIIINDEEEQSVYLLQHLADAIDASFIFEPSPELTYNILTEDDYMISNIDPEFLLKTIENAQSIVERIYSI